MMIEASGGNIRQLLRLARASTIPAENAERQRVLGEDAEKAIAEIQTGLVDPIRRDEKEALREFHLQEGLKLPPSGSLGDTLLRRKWILTYQDERGRLEYALNPLVQTYLEEEGVL